MKDAFIKKDLKEFNNKIIGIDAMKLVYIIHYHCI